MQKYIYLDWNVVKYLRENRDGEEFHDAELKSLLCKLRNRYIFPFSVYHVKDRLSNYNSDYEKEISKDLSFFEDFAERNCIVWDSSQNDIKLAKCTTSTCRSEVEKEKKKKLPIQSITRLMPEISVDMTKIDCSHPMYDFLAAHQAKLNGQLMQEFLESLYESIFDDGILYKKFRNYVNKHKEELLNPPVENRCDLLSFFCRYCEPYIRSFDYSEKKLEENWKNIAESWFMFSYGSEIPFPVLLSNGYILLEGHPLFHDKINKSKNNLSNINIDSNHLYFASKAEYLISEDKRFREKARFLYQVYSIKTKVVSVTEFLEKFC